MRFSQFDTINGVNRARADINYNASMRIREIYRIRYYARGWTIPSKFAVQPKGNYNSHVTLYYKILLMKMKAGVI